MENFFGPLNTMLINGHGKNGQEEYTERRLSNMARKKSTLLIPRSHRELCEIAERWLIGKYGCRIAIAEPNCIITKEQPDAIGWHGRVSVLVEAKTSRSDFLADAKKPFRANPQDGMGIYRYYMCEPDVITIDDLPERWGLLHVLQGDRVRELRRSQRFEADRAEELSLLTACLAIHKPLKIRSSISRRVFQIGKEDVA